MVIIVIGGVGFSLNSAGGRGRGVEIARFGSTSIEGKGDGFVVRDVKLVQAIIFGSGEYEPSGSALHAKSCTEEDFGVNRLMLRPRFSAE